MTVESFSRPEGSEEMVIDPSQLHPSIALAPYVEALVVGRRVAVLGDASLGLADALVARGARLVHAYDPDAARVAEAIARTAPAFGSSAAGRPAARGVVHALLGDDLGVRDGAFDAAIIPDLSLFEDRPEVVRRAKKLVGSAGAVIVSAANPDAKRRLVQAQAPARRPVGYYELFDLLQLQFPIVRMVGQAPFVGWAIVDFAPDREPDVAFDASLMHGTEEPESFVAIASERPVATDAYLVVEVPAADVLASDARAAIAARADLAPSSAHDRRLTPNDQVQLAETQARLVLMEAELEDLRSQKGELSRRLDQAHTAAEDAGTRAREAQDDAVARARRSEMTLEAQEDRFRDLEARAGDEHVRAERLGHKVRDLEEELVRQRDRAQKLSKQLDDEKRSRQKAEIELGMARGLPRAEPDPESLARIDELTEELRRAKAHADSLASELLAKSKETAELRREHESAQEKITSLGDALAAAHARIDDMEQEATTLRRPPPLREPVVVTGEVQTGMVARIMRLEAAANAEHIAAEESRRLADESKRAMDILSSERDAAVRSAGELQKALDEERAARRDLVIAKAALEAEVLVLKRRIEELQVEREAEAAPEVSQLEAALRDRGHLIAKLERDLRESERIGRELVAEIEALRGMSDGGEGGPANGQGSPRAGGPSEGAPGAGMEARAHQAAAHRVPGAVDPVTADAFQHRIDALAADAAQKQAELLTSTWRIQALEREVSEARAASADPSRAQRELSDALVRAQSEIAELRRALALRGDSGGVPRAVVEDAVLLHQQAAR